jgi:tetratricopeptide (TPR) repeat protein
MKKAVFLFLLLQLATGLSVLFAQATNFEGYEIPEQKEIINDTALFNRLNSLENDFTKFKMIDELLEKAYYSKKLLNYVYLQLDFAKKKESGKLMAHSYYNLARMYYNAEEYDTSITYYRKAEFIYKSLKNDSILSNIYYELSRAYFFLEQNEMLVYELKKAVVYVTEVSDIRKTAKYLRGIGVGYFHLGQYDSALNYLNRSLKISLKNNLAKNTVFTYSMLGLYYHRIGEYEKAVEKQYLAFKYLRGRNFPRARLIVSMRIAEEYFSLNQPDSSLKYCNQVLDNSKPGRLKNTAYIIAAKAYNFKNDFPRALAYIDSANNYTKKIKSINLQDKVYKVYVDIYTKKNDPEKVLYYKNLQIANFGLMIKKNNMSRLMNINILSTIDKFEENNNLLQEQKRENELMLENSKKLNILFGIISLLGLAVVVIILFFLKRIKAKQQIIKEQNSKLHNKNIELEETLNQLHNAQSKLLQSEKMASLGMLSAVLPTKLTIPSILFMRE